MGKTSSVFFLLFLCFFSFAQKTKENPRLTIRGVIGIPRSTGSMMFRQSFSGIYEANLTVCMKAGKNFFIGAGYQNALFKNVKSIGQIRYNYGTSGQVLLTPYNTQIIEHSALLKFGYEHYTGDIVYVSYSLNSGLMFGQYTGVLPDTSEANRPYGPTKFAAPFVQPEIAINFLSGEGQKLSFSILLSYTTLFYKYDPKSPRFNHFATPPIYIKSNRYFMNWINIGLGFNILPGKKGQTTAAPVGD
jgi:hypothetical protein